MKQCESDLTQGGRIKVKREFLTMDTDESFDSGMKAWSEVTQGLDIELLWIQMKS